MLSIFKLLPRKTLTKLKPNLKLLIQTHRFKSSKSKKKEDFPYVILRPEKDCNDEILDLLWDSYYRYEVVSKALNLGRTPNAVLDEMMVKALAQGYSLIARCKYDGCLVGVAINESVCSWQPGMMEKYACDICNPILRQLLLFKAHVQKLPDLWNLACTPKVFEIAHLCVKADDRGRGLATALVRQSVDTGADCGYTCIRIDASNVFTQQICNKLKMKLVYQIPYCTYIGADEKPVINPPPPDTDLKVYVVTPLLPKRK